MFAALARLASEHPKRVLLVTGVLAVLAAAVGGPVAGLLTASPHDFEDSSSPSVKAHAWLARAAAVEPSPGIVALLRPAAAPATRAGRAEVSRAAATIASAPEVARVVQGPVSRDGRETYLAAFTRAGADGADAALRVQERLGPRAVLGGPDLAQHQIGASVQSDLARAELLAFPILFALSLWVFRGLIAALLPPLVGGLTVVATFLALRGVEAVQPLSIFALNLVTGLGLGLAIDYSLFIVSRYREELEAHGPGAEALRRTLLSAGRTVLFSSLTVASALASLLVFPQRFLYSMGIGGALCALLAASVSLIALPAGLALLGPRINAGAPARWRRAGERSARGEAGGAWYRLSRAVMRRPALIAAASTALLVALALPALGVRFTAADASVLPHGRSAREVDDALKTRFAGTQAAPLYVALRAPASAELSRYAAALRARRGAVAVTPPRFVGEDTWRVDVFGRGAPSSESSRALVREVREVRPSFPVAAGGEAAAFVDQQRSLATHLGAALAILVAVTLLLLWAMTGSVVLPFKALVMNALTLSATFGLLVLVFQDGRLQGVLDYTSQGALEATQPILLCAIAFGLSTDYGVFLLARIKEARDRGADESASVAAGLERTGRIVTAAALLFCVAIGAFATSGVVFIKEVGLGTAAAVALDASIVRALLVPSLMALLGRRNWWSPAPLRRLHARIGPREEARAVPAESAPA